MPSPDTAGGAEWDLDTQSSTGMAQNVQALYLYDTTSLSDSDIANEYSKWVGDDLAQLGNSSFGECEYQAWLDGAMKVDDNLFMQAAAQGQTMFVSTGDTGASCALAPTNGAPMSGPPMVEYPAASSFVVGVGGTTVVVERVRLELCGRSRVERRRRWAEPVRERDQLGEAVQILPSTGPAATNLRGLARHRDGGGRVLRRVQHLRPATSRASATAAPAARSAGRAKRRRSRWARIRG